MLLASFDLAMIGLNWDSFSMFSTSGSVLSIGSPSGAARQRRHFGKRNQGSM